VRFSPRSTTDKLARPAVARIETVALDRELRAGGGDAPAYRIVARVISSPEPIPEGARVEAEIILRQRPFWRFLFGLTGS
jgi:hypothetical protein